MTTQTLNHRKATDVPAPSAWTIDRAKALYNIEGWGAGYFDINERGHVVVRAGSNGAGRELDLYDLAHDLQAQGVGLPILLRFSDILADRIKHLHDGFQSAIREYEYTGTYTSVYPIKVNQQRHVVEEIVQFGRSTGVGLECGSKPELQAVLGLVDRTDHLIICNGYKDEEFLRLALMGQKLGHQVFIVLEQLSELDVLLQVAAELGVRPNAGVRIKLAAEGSGRWAQSGGEKSKFGLTTAQLVKLLDKLKAADSLDILKLIHFHVGSQVTDIRYIKSALSEIARYYVELRSQGLDITHVDVGGGLGVDYDGTASTNQASINYTLQEYASDVVYTLSEACKENELPMPAIVSESGRALTAHHALLLMNVIDVESQGDPELPVLVEDDHQLLHEMLADYKAVNKRRVREIFHDAVYSKEKARNLFFSGVITLRQLAQAEQIYLATINAVAKVVETDRKKFSDISAVVDDTLIDRYFCNFSLFQSLPDNWAIDQLFPIMPIHRLDEEPTRQATLQDVTCDSDGKIDKFIGDKPSLELHAYKEGDPYVLGIFMTGAYQEILGDLHNLFGDTHAVHVRLGDGNGYEVTDLVRGDTVTEVLDYVEFRAADLLATFRRKVQNCAGITRAEANTFIADYVAGLEGYTYLEGEGPVS